MGTDKKWKIKAIVIGVAVVVAVIGLILVFNFLTSEEKETPYLSVVRLTDKKIKPGGTTLLKTRILNPGTNVYENAEIRIISGCPKIEMSLTSPGVETKYENQTTPEGKFEQSLTVKIPYNLGKKFESALYTFDIRGDVYSGVRLMIAEIEVHLIVEGELVDNRVLGLTISSKS